MTSPEQIDALQRRWVRLSAGLGVEPARAYPGFDALIARYTAADRFYHTPGHLAEMFRVLDRLATADPVAIELAVWFHDAVYDPRRDDNELASAHAADRYLRDDVGPVGRDPDGLARTVVALIRATDHKSDGPPPDADTGVLLDCDLAILAAPDHRYQRYVADVRREYAWVSDADWRAGRARVLEHFLARPRVYHTGVMFTEGEAAARRNLRAEIDRLRAG